MGVGIKRVDKKKNTDERVHTVKHLKSEIWGLQTPLFIQKPDHSESSALTNLRSELLCPLSPPETRNYPSLRRLTIIQQRLIFPPNKSDPKEQDAQSPTSVEDAAVTLI